MTIPVPICAGDTVLVADVGNTRTKLAVVADRGAHGPAALRRLPGVSRRQDLLSRSFHPDHLRNWLGAAAPGAAVLLVSAVNESAAVRLEAAVAELSVTGTRPLRQRRVGCADLPLVVDVEEPRRVGLDRLAAAAAAAIARRPGHPAIVVDCGTATTVDMISADGVFLGGAILAGPALLARALAEGTSRLPEVAALEEEPPPRLPGRSTAQAIAAGIGWGMRGAVARLVTEARETLMAGAAGHEPDLFLTGGSAGIVRDALPAAVELPDLVLCGIALAAERACSR
jgi:type III pantothenate kinase